MECYYCRSHTAESYLIVNNETGATAYVCKSCNYVEKEFCVGCKKLNLVENLFCCELKKLMCKDCVLVGFQRCSSCNLVSICKCSCGLNYCQKCSIKHYLEIFTNFNHYFDGRIRYYYLPDLTGVDDYVKDLIYYEEIPFQVNLDCMKNFYIYISNFVMEKSKVGLKRSEYFEYYRFVVGILYIVAGSVLYGQYLLKDVNITFKKDEKYLRLVLVFGTKSFILQEIDQLSTAHYISDNLISISDNYLTGKKKKISKIEKLLKQPCITSAGDLMILTAYLRSTKPRSKVGKFIDQIELFFQGITVLPILYKIKGKALKDCEDLTRAIVLCNQIWKMDNNYIYKYMKAMMMVILI